MENVKTFDELVREKIAERNLEGIKKIVSDMHPGDIVDGLESLEVTERPIVFRLLPKGKAVDVFDMLDPAVQGDLVESLTDEQAVEFLGELDPDDRVHLLDELPARVAKKLVERLPKEKRDITNRLLGYEDGTVGRIMSPLFVDVKRDMTVEEAQKRIRERKEGRDWAITTVYVTDEARKFVGAIALSDLVTCAPGTRVGELLDEDQTSMFTVDPEEDAARLLQDRDINELPVLDREDRLVGVLPADDAMDVLEHEATSDMYDKAGLISIQTTESDRSYSMINGSLWHVIVVRVPFLLVTLVGGMLAGVVIGAWEETLEAVVATALFIPVIMDMGGNVGTQSSTIFTRGLVLGQIPTSRFVRFWLRETWNGFAMGAVLGVLGGLIAFFWQGIAQLGVAIALSLTFTITIAASVGFLIPFILVKFGFDQAAGADPFITTVKDITGLIIYFSMVTLLVPGVV